MKKILICSLLAASFIYANNSAQININDNTLEIGADLYLNNSFDLNNNSNYYFGISYLSTESSNNQSSQKLTSASFKVLNPYSDDYGLSLGLGIKALYTNQMSKNFIAIPLSVFIKYELNEVVYFDLEGSYSPNVLSFVDAQKYSDVKLRANYKVLDNGYGFIGARNIKTKYDNANEKQFDSSVFFGYEFRF